MKKGGLTLLFKNRLYLNKITFFGKEKKKILFYKRIIIEYTFLCFPAEDWIVLVLVREGQPTVPKTARSGLRDREQGVFWVVRISHSRPGGVNWRRSRRGVDGKVASLLLYTQILPLSFPLCLPGLKYKI